ncbi:nuclear transport factor 2 family protein [Pararhizobium mangrovi]|uniref:Nuclear transport factor 2 family protein n=1 Tax=Pararhizobium mangrovi TaxID=2590452 RepID=A0A506U4E3_9HYPH|nr:nuclear transport factor 2 family protein [Pararhizobium mangrovi]TPW28181.1 nuclear transport factor 2 family protein [Pararhizobium mangrovi]
MPGSPSVFAILQVCVLALSSLACCFEAATARDEKPPRTPTPSARPQADASDARLVLVLVRNVFVAVGQAIAAGNYSVLRDLAAPGFRRSFPESRLATVFEPLAEARIDFSTSVLLVPKIARAGFRDDGTLIVEGVMPTSPDGVRFRLLFQRIDGGWQLLGISMDAVADRQAPASTGGAESAKPSRSPSPHP